MYWSGPAIPGLPPQVMAVLDSVVNAGPLAGISACLSLLRSDFLIVLAVDLPRMSADFLQLLPSRCSPGCGIVVSRDGMFEPLAAIYPKELQTLATRHLSEGRYALRDFIATAVQGNAIEVWPLPEDDAYLFTNLNTPDDWEAVRAGAT